MFSGENWVGVGGGWDLTPCTRLRRVPGSFADAKLQCCVAGHFCCARLLCSRAVLLCGRAEAVTRQFLVGETAVLCYRAVLLEQKGASLGWWCAIALCQFSLDVVYFLCQRYSGPRPGAATRPQGERQDRPGSTGTPVPGRGSAPCIARRYSSIALADPCVHQLVTGIGEGDSTLACVYSQVLLPRPRSTRRALAQLDESDPRGGNLPAGCLILSSSGCGCIWIPLTAPSHRSALRGSSSVDPIVRRWSY